MLSAVASLSSLLLGIGILFIGGGFFGTLVSIRAGIEHFNATTTGFVMSAYFVGFILGTVLCPLLIRRVGHIRAFTALAAIASTTAFSHVLFIHPVFWFVLRIIFGIALVGLYIVIESWLNILAPKDGRGRFFAAYTAISLAASAMGQGLLLVGDLSGFVPFAMVSILFSLALVPVALTQVAQPVVVEPVSRLKLRYLYRRSPLGVAGSLIAGLVNGAFWGMGPVFGHNMHFSHNHVAAFMAVVILGGAVLQWPIGHWSDSHDRRRVIVAVACAGALLAISLNATTGVGGAFLASAFLYGGFSFTIYALSVSHVNDQLLPQQVLEATRALLLVYGVGAAAGPASAGMLMEMWGPGGLPVYFATLLGGLALFGLYRMARRVSVPAEEQEAFVPMTRTSPVVLEMDPRAEVRPAPQRSVPQRLAPAPEPLAESKAA